MNTRMKRRMIAATGAIVIVLIVVLAVVGGNSAAKTVSIAEAAEMADSGKKVQVTGNVVENSFTIEGDTLIFSIYDGESDDPSGPTLRVRHDGGVSATFGNDVTAICTGKVAADGTLVCSELVTKCPAKYEDATTALTISELLEYGDDVVDKPVKVTGVVRNLAGVDQDVRFMLANTDTETELPIIFAGALPDEVAENEVVVLTGSIGADGTFTATAVALEA